MTLIQNTNSSINISTIGGTVIGHGDVIPMVDAIDPTNAVESELFDSVLQTYTASTFKNYQCSPRNGALVTNLTPELATLNGSLRLIRIASGKGKVEFSKHGQKTVRDYDTRIKESDNYPVFVRYKDGTVSKALENEIMGLVDSDTGKKDVSYYSTIDHQSSTYQRNSNCWARNVDLSCMSVATGQSGSFGNERPGVLVTPRHVSVANHYRPNIGEKLRFATPSGSVREVSAIGISGVSMDRCVMTLSAPVTGCSIASIPGQWIYQETDTKMYFGGMLLNTNKRKECGICLFGQPDFAQPNEITTHSYNGYSYSGPTLCNISWWKHPWLDQYISSPPYDYIAFVGSGTSGHPVFAIIEGHPVLMMQYLLAQTGPAGWQGNTNDNLMDIQIAEADADAIFRNNLTSPTGYSVTVAPNPIS